MDNQVAEIFFGIIGLIMLYSIIHFFVIQFLKAWKDRSTYEKVITIIGIVCISLIILGALAES